MRKMKDSGVEWIGEIPVDWKLSKIGSVYDERNEKVSDKDFAPLSVTKQGIVPQLETAAKTDNGDNRKLIRKDDFVINSRSDRRGSCGISEYEGSCSLINTVLKPQTNMCNRYYGFVFKSDGFADEYYRWGHGIVDDLWSTKWIDMKSIYIPAPDIIEQERLADYLDAKCSKIDEIIEKQQAIIEKLKEYKLSIITEAVTKGLNPDVEMKDSGNIEIGKIPSIRKPTKLKHLCNTQGRIGFKGYTTADLVDEGEGAYTLGASHLNNGKIDLTDPVFISWEKYYESPEIMVKQNDILIVQRGSTIGKVAIVDKNYGEVTINPSLVLINKIHIDSKYLLYALSARYIVNYINLIGTTTAIPMISQKQINDLVIIVPPDSIQISVVKYLDEKCGKIDANILKKQKLIDKLQEYKKSLIYEVVTGKKEV